MKVKTYIMDFHTTHTIKGREREREREREKERERERERERAAYPKSVF